MELTPYYRFGALLGPISISVYGGPPYVPRQQKYKQALVPEGHYLLVVVWPFHSGLVEVAGISEDPDRHYSYAPRKGSYFRREEVLLSCNQHDDCRQSFELALACLGNSLGGRTRIGIQEISVSVDPEPGRWWMR